MTADINPVDPEAVREFNSAMKKLHDYGREFDHLTGDQEQRLAALWWLAQPKFNRFDWMDDVSHEINEKMIGLVAKGDSAEAGKIFADILASRHVIAELREAYGEPETGPDESELNRRLFDRNEAQGLNHDNEVFSGT